MLPIDPQDAVDRLVRFQAAVRDLLVQSRNTRGLHEVNRDSECENTRAETLREVQGRRHARRHAAKAVARFSPAMLFVGDRCFGQYSVQLWWL